MKEGRNDIHPSFRFACLYRGECDIIKCGILPRRLKRMIILAWGLLITVPILLGLGMMTIIYRKDKTACIGFADSLVCGFLGSIGVIQIAHTVGLFGKLSLDNTGALLLSLLLVSVVFMAGVSLIGICKNKSLYKGATPYETVPTSLVLLVLAVYFVQSLFVFCRNPIIVPGDITLETVQSFFAEDGIYRVMPLSGVESELGMPVRYSILCLPTFYAVLSEKMNLDAELVVCHMVPVVILGISYLAYFRLSESLFGPKAWKQRYYFILVVELLITFSDKAVFLDGYGALHAGYMGTSIRNLILVPYVISAMLERRYWKAALCILAEACIVWTFYGCGVCLAISLGMLILEILERKVPFIGRFQQIFREKEEQA